VAITSPPYGTRRPLIPMKTSLRTYYVYDDGLRERDYLGGIPVKWRDGYTVVAMLPQQAEYWIARGTIGPVPLAEVTGNNRAMLHQLSGGRIPTEEGMVEHVVRNARQDPNTMADKVAQGYHPILGTTTTTEEQRAQAKARAKTTQFNVWGGRK
jgi:hypothetical protein